MDHGALGGAPTGRDEVTASLIAATERLCATGQPSSFTVRQLAAEANVTPSLLYFYFGSKDALIMVTIRTIASEIDVLVAGSSGIDAMISSVSHQLVIRPAFPRLLAWLVLEGRSFPELADAPFLARLIKSFADTDSLEPDTQAGAIVTMLLGSFLFVSDVNVGLGRTRDDERLARVLVKGVVAIASESAAMHDPQ